MEVLRDFYPTRLLPIRLVHSNLHSHPSLLQDRLLGQPGSSVISGHPEIHGLPVLPGPPTCPHSTPLGAALWLPNVLYHPTQLLHPNWHPIHLALVIGAQSSG